MKRNIAALILILIVAIGLMGCGATASTTAATTAAATTKPAATTEDLSIKGNPELNDVYAAKYTQISTTYRVDGNTIGKTLYAAEGTASDGTKVVGMKVMSAKTFNHNGYSSTGWEEAVPGAYTMAIVVDKATHKVIASKVLVDGTRKSDYFTVPQAKIDAYKTVAITGEDVFDAFKDGLVMDIDAKLEKSSDGSTIIAGTSIVYSGTSEDGTLSGQLVRNCFKTAARFYSNYAK